MRHLLSFTVALFGISFVSNLAEAKEANLGDLMPSYVSIQEALAADDIISAQKQANELISKIQASSSKEMKGLKANLGSMSKSTSIADARKEFKKVSGPFVKWAESHKDASFEIVYCPMAGAKWVQKKGDVLNPYYGKEMLNCGEKI